MDDDSKSGTHRWVLPLLVGIFCGGLGGSVFTWYMNRPQPTVVTYRIASTTLAAPEATGLIPNLKVLIGGNQIQALYAYNVEFLARQGPYADELQVALSFASPAHVYGLHEETPSDLHSMDCSGLSVDSSATVQLPDAGKEVRSIHCTLRPLQIQKDDPHPFRVTMATDRSEQPQVAIAARNIEIVAADQFEPRQAASIDRSTFRVALDFLEALTLLGLIVFFLTWPRKAKVLRRE